MFNLKTNLTLKIKNSSVWLTNQPFDPRSIEKEVTGKMMKDLIALERFLEK